MTAMTRANAEYSLVKRQGPRMTMVGLAITTAGSNTDLNDPMAMALIAMSLNPASPSLITDSDISAITTDEWPQFLDQAELRLLETISGQIDFVDISVGPRSESMSQFSAMVDKAIERLQLRITQQYGVGLGSLSSGIIQMDFAQKGDDTVIT